VSRGVAELENASQVARFVANEIIAFHRTSHDLYMLRPTDAAALRSQIPRNKCLLSREVELGELSACKPSLDAARALKT